MTDITNEDLAPLLAQDDPEFRAFVERFDPKCWARYDLSAMRVGYHYGREPLLARIAELEAQIKAAREQEPVAAQHRFRSPQKTRPNWSIWQPCAVANRPPWEIDSQGYEVEYRNLYAAPVPTPADEELRRDAERYRWLRDQIKSGPLVIAKCDSWDLESWSGDDPDTRIDEAMEKEEGK